MDIQRVQLVEKLSDYLIKAFAKEDIPLIKSFIQHYLMSISSKDLLEKSIPDLFGSILSHWDFLQKKRKLLKVRAYNPTLAQDNWSSQHTIVEVCATSLPFLLDSIRIALHDLGVQIHLIVELNVLTIRRDKHGLLKECCFKNTKKDNNFSELSFYL
jgi:glutamate dehydrogenase